jgi:serine/threonine protein kinase
MSGSMTGAEASDPDPTDPAPSALDRMLRGLGTDVDEAIAGGAMRCGPYMLVDQIGEGGFGEVFAAIRDDASARRVAVKILKLGIDTKDVLRRFELEQRALARIDHPSVAAILDSGKTVDGRPWFAMPLLDGDPVTIACDESRGALHERISLMTMICDAVQAAHVQGIVHRDLKPANVLLVAGGDGSLVPKVIDFGIAKAMDPDAAFAATRTMSGRRVGTPAYMAPEQLTSVDAGADVRSDVFAMGVILAELVAGVRPPPALQGGDRGLPVQVSRMYAALVSGEPLVAQWIAERRGHRSARDLRRALAGDIDAIVAKATMPEPDHRYRSAEAMAEDLRRMRASLPVLARSPSRSYHLARFVRRHRRTVIAAAVGALGLVAVSVIAVANAIRAETAGALASRNALRAEQVTGLLHGVFERIDPEVAQGRDRTLLVELLQGTLVEIREQDSSIDPKAAAQVSRIVAEALLKLEQTRMALVAADEAIARVGSRIVMERDPLRRRELRVERAAMRVVRGMVLFQAAWAEAGVLRQRLEDPDAEAEWRTALEELSDVGALDTPTALLARLRLWRIREVWPEGIAADSFDSALERDMEGAPLGDVEHWTFRLRKAEIQNWREVLRDYPQALSECGAAMGETHPLVVRARNRLLAFSVTAAIESRTSRSGDSVELWITEGELADHWLGTAELSDRVVRECTQMFGPAHTQTLSARLWQLAAHGHLRGAPAVRQLYRSLRDDAIDAAGPECALVMQADMTWRGIVHGYAAGRWW